MIGRASLLHRPKEGAGLRQSERTKPALRRRGGEEMDDTNRGLGWFCIRHAGIQLRPLRSAEKRDRLGLIRSGTARLLRL